MKRPASSSSHGTRGGEEILKSIFRLTFAITIAKKGVEYDGNDVDE